VARWTDSDNKAEVTCIARSPNGTDYAVGYGDGAIRLFDLENNTVRVVLNGHRGRVSALEFDPTGTVLASGARDTDLIVWDVVGEVGLYRLRGHTDEITAIGFLGSSGKATSALNASADGWIVTGSKDTLVKLWDLRAQHCVQTLVAHRSEVWALALSHDQRLLVTGTADRELRVWTVDTQKLNSMTTEPQDEPQTMAVEEAAQRWEAISEYGTIERASRDRVVSLQFHPSGQYLGCLGGDRQLEVFRARTHAEIKKKMARRLKRSREKRKTAMDVDGEGEGEGDEPAAEITAADELTAFKVVRTSAKAVSFDFAPAEADAAALHRQGALQVLVAQSDNQVGVWRVPVPPPGTTTKKAALADPSLLCAVDMVGHRAEPRTLALSSDNELLASAAGRSLRIWNVQTGSCVRTLECGQALCAAFLPGDQFVVVGTKGGMLELYDVPAAALVETFDAHEGAACWAVDVKPDGSGLVTGGADKCVKFWDFELVRDAQSDASVVSRRRMTLEHVKTLKMSDDVLAVKCSPDSRLLAVSLLDTTVKVFYADTLKFFLSLYGHKLPVMSLDISSDSTLLVTGSADKSVKLWGLDFGDCHRSLLAHQEPVTCVRFVWGTHYFFSAGKDRVVQQWDGDKFQRIQRLEGSHGDVWALTVGKFGNFVVAGCQDRSLRVWDKTEEPLFLEEERERELEALYDRGLEEALDRTDQAPAGQEDGDEPESGRAGRATMETLKAGERIMEALDLADEERAKWDAYNEQKRRMPNMAPAAPDVNPVLQFEKLTPDAYVLRTVERVRAAELEDALLVLPFARVLALLEYVDVWARRRWNTPLTCRVLFFLLKTHQSQIAATRAMRPRLDSIRRHLRAVVAGQRDQIGFNLAALGALKAEWEATATAEFFDEAQIQAVLDSQLAKRKFTGLRA
ncbi:beta transducin, partial [Linderina macrospora]